LSVYRLHAPYERSPLGRRLSSFGLALAINVALLIMLITLGIIPPPGQKDSHGLVVDLIPESRSASPTHAEETRHQHVQTEKPVPKPPPIVLPAKPTIAVPPKPAPKTKPWVEMSKDDMAAGDISKLASAGAGSEGDTEAVGHGPHGEILYAAEWARHPTNTELDGYLPHDRQDGWGLIACKTVPGDRVEDCVELDQYPLGSHLASAVRQAAWQFRVRPPRKNGRAMVGEWVSIRIDYSFIRTGGL
jgi:protein TonB